MVKAASLVELKAIIAMPDIDICTDDGFIIEDEDSFLFHASTLNPQFVVNAASKNFEDEESTQYPNGFLEFSVINATPIQTEEHFTVPGVAVTVPDVAVTVPSIPGAVTFLLPNGQEKVI